MIKKHLGLIRFLALFIVLGQCLQAQETFELMEGYVSYLSGSNIYVKFVNTMGIENGDTLFTAVQGNRTPALVVQHHSTLSCLCTSISSNPIKLKDKIIAKRYIAENKEEKQLEKELKLEQDVNEEVLKKANNLRGKKSKADAISGRVQFSSYSNLSNTDTDFNNRFRYTLSLQADKISNSKISAETYLAFTHKQDEWNEVSKNPGKALKVFNLAVNYDLNSSTEIWVGRKINSKIANVGAVDGVQFEKKWSDFYIGSVVGSRPDYTNYGYDASLFEYGAYFGHNKKLDKGYAQTSLAVFEQKNSGFTDRRFAYFQHSNSLLTDLSLFTSCELDLYKLDKGEPVSDVSLTSLYVSLNYKFSRKLSLFTSYDNRKNVIYYETFRSYSDEILQVASRQGARVRVLYRPIKYLNIGLNAGSRFQKDNPRSTNTYRGYASYSSLPWIKASFTLSSNYLQTSYLDGLVFESRLSKDFFEGKLYSTLNYRWVRFDYVNMNTQLKQHVGEIDFSYRFNKKTYLSINMEGTMQGARNYERIYLNLRRKF